MFISITDKTHILQARKQMEYDNNEHLQTNNLITKTYKIKIIRNTYYVRAAFVENSVVTSWMKIGLFVRVCLHVSKVD